MKIKTLSIHSYQIPFLRNQTRSGALIHITNEEGNSSWGEIAPLPNWSRETLEDALKQMIGKKQSVLSIDWTTETCFEELRQLNLYPSVIFGLESALLTLLVPISKYTFPISALLIGSPREMIEHANLRLSEGFTSAKLKVGHLTFQQAEEVIFQLKDKLHLRIDVNRAWETADALRFFSQFPRDAFDYVEEPFKNPHELIQFQHPLAIDESFPQELSLKQLEELPMLKALIYKPTIQGGLLGCLPLHEWAVKRGVFLVLSSSFESNIGLAHVAAVAYRLSMLCNNERKIPPVGIGTYHYMQKSL